MKTNTFLLNKRHCDTMRSYFNMSNLLKEKIIKHNIENPRMSLGEF